MGQTFVLSTGKIIDPSFFESFLGLSFLGAATKKNKFVFWHCISANITPPRTRTRAQEWPNSMSSGRVPPARPSSAGRERPASAATGRGGGGGGGGGERHVTFSSDPISSSQPPGGNTTVPPPSRASRRPSSASAQAAAAARLGGGSVARTAASAAARAASSSARGSRSSTDSMEVRQCFFWHFFFSPLSFSKIGINPPTMQRWPHLAGRGRGRRCVLCQVCIHTTALYRELDTVSQRHLAGAAAGGSGTLDFLPRI
jgi:hypothetical protein